MEIFELLKIIISRLKILYFESSSALPIDFGPKKIIVPELC